MAKTRTLGDTAPLSLPCDDKRQVKDIEGRIKDAQKAAGKAPLEVQIEIFEREATSLIRTAIDAMQDERDNGNGPGSCHRGGLFSRYIREEQKYRNEIQAEVDSMGQLIEGGEFSHLKAGVSAGLYANNVNTVTAWLIETVLGTAGRPFQVRPTGRKDENDEKTRVVIELLDSMWQRSHARSRCAEAFSDLPKHANCALRQSWVEKSAWVRTDARQWEERIVSRGPSLEWWRLLDVFVSNPLALRADEQDAVVWFSRTTLSHLQGNERLYEVESSTVQDPATGQPMEVTKVHSRGKYFNLEKLRRRAGESGRKTFLEQAHDSTSPDGTSAEEDRAGQISAEELLQLWEFQGWFAMGQFYRDGLLTDDLLEHYGIEIECDGGEKGKPKKPEGEALARILDGIMWYASMTEQGSGGNDLLVEMQPCPYREARNELVSGYFVLAGHEFQGLSSDQLAGDVGDTADQVLNNIAAILQNNANPNVATFINRLADTGGTADAADKLAKLWAGNGQVIPFNESGGVAIKDIIQPMIRPYDPSMPNFFNQLGEIYGLRTLSSALAQGGQAQTESDTLGEGQAQLKAVGQRLAEVATRLSGEQIVQPIVMNMLKDLDWFFTPDELVEEAKRVCGQAGLDFDKILPTAAVEGGGARRPLCEDFIVEGNASAEIQKEVAIQFLLKMGQAAAALPTANLQANFEACYDLMGFDPQKFFKKADGPLPVRKIIEMILAGDKPKVDPQMNAVAALQELQMNRVAFGQIKDQLANEGHSTEDFDGFIKVLDGFILDVGDLAAAQQQAQQQAMMAMAQQQMARQGGGKAQGGPNAGAGAPGAGPGPGMGDQPPQGPNGVLQGIQNGAGRMAAQPPPGTAGPRA